MENVLDGRDAVRPDSTEGERRPMSSTDPDRVLLYHGTRQSYAQAIRCAGFHPLPVHTQIVEVAHSIGIDVGVLQSHLNDSASWGRIDPRKDSVCLTASVREAEDYAGRAPEATWEALKAVHELTAGRDVRPGESDFWAFAQRSADSPVVVTVSVLAEHAKSRNGTPYDEVAALGDDILEQAEFRCAPSEVSCVHVQRVPLRLDAVVAMFMSDQSRPEFLNAHARGEWGEFGGRTRGMTPWFWFGDFWPRLPAERRAELITLAGVDLDDIASAAIAMRAD